MIKKKINSLTIIVYHYVRPVKKSKFPKLKALEFKVFKKQLEYLSKKYTFISYDDLLNLANKKTKFKNPCLLTFDDGYKDHIKYVLPELKKRKIKGCFFPSVEAILKKKVLNVNKIQFILAKEKNISNILHDTFDFLIKKKLINKSDKSNILKLKKKFVNKTRPYDNKNVAFLKYLLQIYFSENIQNRCCDYLFRKYVTKNEKAFSKNLYMSIKDIKYLIKSNMYIGGHGFQHEHFSILSKKEKQVEIKKNILFLKKIGANTKNWAMCYPYGTHDNETIKILKKNNCIFGLTIKSGQNIFSKKKNFYNLKRIDANEFVACL